MLPLPLHQTLTLTLTLTRPDPTTLPGPCLYSDLCEPRGLIVTVHSPPAVPEMRPSPGGVGLVLCTG